MTEPQKLPSDDSQVFTSADQAFSEPIPADQTMSAPDPFADPVRVRPVKNYSGGGRRVIQLGFFIAFAACIVAAGGWLVMRFVRNSDFASSGLKPYIYTFNGVRYRYQREQFTLGQEVKINAFPDYRDITPMTTPVARDKKIYQAKIDANKAMDREKFYRVSADPSFVEMTNGTPARIVALEGALAQVEILQGDYAGQKFWLLQELLIWTGCESEPGPEC